MMHSTIRTTALILSLGVSHMAFAQDNYLLIDQVGNYSAGNVTQYGQANVGMVKQISAQTKKTSQNAALAADIQQNGLKNEGYVRQESAVDQTYIRAGIGQDGARNKATVDQLGDGFTGLVYQTGSKNVANIQSRGVAVASRIDQLGEANTASINGTGTGASADSTSQYSWVKQNGTQNTADVTFIGQKIAGGEGERAGLDQTGTLNAAKQDAYGYGTQMFLKQQGVGNRAMQYTYGSNGKKSATVSDLRQEGENNVASTFNAGSDNLATAVQQGISNNLTQRTVGTNNTSTHTQIGRTNLLTSDAEGTGNIALATQNGVGNMSEQLIRGDTNNSRVTQLGNTSDAHILQYGNNNTGTIDQNSNQTKPAQQNVSLAATIDQKGNNNSSTINQVNAVDQNYIRAGTLQRGERNNVTIDQQGASFTTVTFQRGVDNKITSASTGNFAAQRLVQTGDRNNMGVTINGGGEAYKNDVPEISSNERNINYVHMIQKGSDNKFNATLSGSNVHVNGAYNMSSDDTGSDRGAVQEGNSNVASVNLTGTSARVDALEQKGNGNYSSQTINNTDFDKASVSRLYQNGTENRYELLTDGTGTIDTTNQNGNNNNAKVKVAGNSNYVDISQTGSGNMANVDLNGSDNRASIKQNGIGNSAEQIVVGNGNNLSIVQNGTGNTAYENIRGNNNSMSLNQRGNYNNGSLTFTGNNSSFDITQQGNNQNYVINQTGNDVHVNVLQKQM